jgi:hypothetical protein
MSLRLLLFGTLAVATLLCLEDLFPRIGASAVPAPASKEEPAANFVKDVVPFLTKHCYACHGNGKKRAGLALDKYPDDEAVQKDRRVWENVLHMVRSGQMPPPERPRPAVKETEAVLQSIDAVLAKLDCSKVQSAGRVTLRRLNKVEYNNTIRDLVGIDFKPAADFPNDDVGYGFDNIGDVLSLSPLLLERYLAAADAILERAIVLADPPKPARNRLGSLQVSFGAGETMRGGAVLHSKGSVSAESYLDEGDYVIRVQAYGLQVGDEPVRAAVRIGRNEGKEFEVKATDAAPATLEVHTRVRTGTARVSVSFLNPFTDKTAEPAKQRQLFVRSIEVEGPFNPPAPVLPESHKRIMGIAGCRLQIVNCLSCVRLELAALGSLSSATHHLPSLQSAICNLQSAIPREAARDIVTRFADRAFRRPVKPEEVSRFLKLYDRAEKEGERFESRVRLALSGVLVSPHFLFRVELDPPGAKPQAAYNVSEYELASRLSYFLWSSMPDDELFALAAKGELRKNLEAQVRRMVKDPKSAALVQNFAGQWLTLPKLDMVTPDPKVFPNFDAELRAAMYRETELFFEAVLREDHSILDLLDADFSFVNERLAKHYGIDGVKGKEFQRVKLPANRGGILTHASILTLTSSPTRTSPVKRGKWVLDQLLNTPPPPPPDDVPELTEEKQLKGSLRQVMEMHRTNALCASCHSKMDPIGFAFENYDAIGVWRDKDGRFDIDPSGVLPDGKAFKGPAELKSILRGKKDLFGRCLAEKMLTYALGRGLEFYDKCAVDKILKALDKNDYRFSTLLLEVVNSDPFQMRTSSGVRGQESGVKGQ